MQIPCWGLTLWYGNPEVRTILPSCLATCAGGSGGETCSEGSASFCDQGCRPLHPQSCLC